MKRMLGVLLLLLVAAPAMADRVIDLPELAAGRWYLTVIVGSGYSQADGELLRYMGGSSIMSSVKDQVVYNEYEDSDAIISGTAWKTYLGDARPAVLLQSTAREDGTADVVFFAAGDSLDTATLAGQMQAAINKYQKELQAKGQCPPRGPCPYPVLPRVPLPRPAPYPQPQPQPNPQPTVPTTPPPAVTPIVPTIVPPKPEEPKPEDSGGIPIWMFALPVIAAGAGMWKAFDHS